MDNKPESTFFDHELMTRSAVSNAWRAGHGMDVKPGADLPRVCQELGELLEMPGGHCRLSQRTGAVLVNGAARMYKEKADDLLKDLSEFPLQMMLKGKPQSFNNSSALAPGGGGETSQVAPSADEQQMPEASASP